MKKRTLIFIFFIAVLLGSAYLGISYVLYDLLTNVEENCDTAFTNRPDYFTDTSDSWPEGFDFSPYYMPNYENVRFSSREAGIMIAGWYVEAAPDAPAVILVHGLKSCKNSHGVLTAAGMLHNAGFNVLMLDMRDHGESDYEDGRFAVGNEEYLDVLGGWDWLVQEKNIPPAQIGMVGFSLGAATTLIAFSQEPQLAAVFVDSPFENLPQIIQEELDRNSYPRFLTPGGLLIARFVSGDDVLAHNPYEGILRSAGRPIFVVHGTADTRISINHTYQLQARAQSVGANATFWIPEGIGHTAATGEMPAEYETRLVSFFQDALIPGK